MKKGTVIYLTDAVNASEQLEDESAIASLGLDPAWTLIAASQTGFYELGDATQELIRRGAHHVEAVRAKWDARGLRLFGDYLHVFG